MSHFYILLQNVMKHVELDDIFFIHYLNTRNQKLYIMLDAPKWNHYFNVKTYRQPLMPSATYMRNKWLSLMAQDLFLSWFVITQIFFCLVIYESVLTNEFSGARKYFFYFYLIIKKFNYCLLPLLSRFARHMLKNFALIFVIVQESWVLYVYLLSCGLSKKRPNSMSFFGVICHFKQQYSSFSS